MEIIRETNEKGQIVIPIDIRKMLKIKSRDKIVFKIKDNEVIIKKKENDAERILEEFFTIARTKNKNLSLKDLKSMEEESYELPRF